MPDAPRDRPTTSTFDPSSRSKLTARDLERFPGESLFARIARVVCEAECLPRKELYESWEAARRIRRRLRGGNVVELAAGHALVAQMLLLLDGTSERALATDVALPESAAPLREALALRWPVLAGRLRIEESAIESTPIAAGDLVVSIHACGELTDRVIDRAVAARASLALLPCCHDARRCDTGGLDGIMDVSLAIDATRIARLRAAGYEVWAGTIPATITPKNRLIVARA